MTELPRFCGHTDSRSCDILCRVEALERIVHPDGRCWCGAGKPYWKHLDPSADGYHTFAALMLPKEADHA